MLWEEEGSDRGEGVERTPMKKESRSQIKKMEKNRGEPRKSRGRRTKMERTWKRAERKWKDE